MNDDLVKHARYYGSHGWGITLAVSAPEPSPELMDKLADRIEELELELRQLQCGWDACAGAEERCEEADKRIEELEAAVRDAEKRLRGAGMIGSPSNDPVCAALDGTPREQVIGKRVEIA